jgi:NAD(P)H-dependent FMN reductase
VKQKLWSEKMIEMDGYILINPEYSHGMTSALKNALDFVYHELTEKQQELSVMGLLKV